ncbi:MAG: divalent-cation tolerance protein CutA [Acidobacteriia bacterium]|nr:divalent-cation tolerance protein CutA [Methyloceanibacter sp.]MBX5471415.1 divalent-cation tolerance protein CutA [Acetobacteraceae bacterium]MCL6492590.1 divalent-cation tolerance protein CutA [Terriglobia bacterium]
MPYALTMTTCASQEEAERLAEGVITRKLAGCVQILPATSVYEWKGEICKDKEYLLLIKGTQDALPELKAYLLSEHTYELPEIVTLEITGGHERYLAWLSGQR